MEFRNRIISILALLLAARIFAQTTMCDAIFDILADGGLNPAAQSLITGGDNSFPYNILLENPGKKITEADRPAVTLVFFQEDVIARPDLIIPLSGLSDESCDITLLFAYGERQRIQKSGMIFGTEVFARAVSSNEDSTVIICDLEASVTKIVSGSRGTVSPSYLVQGAFNAFTRSGLKKSVPHYYVSQMHSYDFFYDRTLSVFFDSGIPAIRLEFQPGTESSVILDALSQTIMQLSQARARDWDQHFLMVRLFGRFFRLTETATIKIIIAIILSYLAFIFLLGFVNSRLKLATWSEIRHIWYCVPATCILIALAFFLGKHFFMLIARPETDATAIAILGCTQAILALLLCSAFYTIVLLCNRKFGEKSVDYLIVFACFVNQFVFILVDVSLFPIFMTVCLLSLLALVIKNNPLHISVFFLIIVIFLPYITSLAANASLPELRVFLITNARIPLYISVLMYPLFLVYFRILTSIARNARKKLTFFIAQASFLAAILIFLPVLAGALARKTDGKTQSREMIFEQFRESGEIAVTYSDKKIFDDIIRTISINFPRECVQCDVRLFSEFQQPLLYTDNDYTPVTEQEGYFNIPSTPPSQMSFTYGTSVRTSTLILTAFFATDNPDVFAQASQSVTLEARP